MQIKSMINYFQIQRIASQKRIPEDIIEKDYFIELLLLSSTIWVSYQRFRGIDKK